MHTKEQAVSVAVIGIGVMGKNHARVYAELPEANLVAIADTDKKQGELVASRFNCRYYADYRTMLEKEKPLAVSIATPTTTHYEIGLECLESGAHVLMEKPLAGTIEEGEKLIAKAEAKNKLLMVGHIERFNPAILELKKRINAGKLGKIFMIHSRRQSPFPSRIMDVGVALDLASHELDIMRYLSGSEVETLNSQVSRVLHPHSEDIVFSVLKFKNGILGVLDVNWVTPTKIREISITGERGMYVANYLTQELVFHENAGIPDEPGKFELYAGQFSTVLEGQMIKYQINKREPLVNELEAFVKCIRAGKKPVPDGRDGLEALKLIFRILDSKSRSVKGA